MSCGHGDAFAHELLGSESANGERTLYCSKCGKEWKVRYGKIRRWNYGNGDIRIADETGYEITLTSDEMSRISGVWMNHRRAMKINGLPEETSKTIEF